MTNPPLTGRAKWSNQGAFAGAPSGRLRPTVRAFCPSGSVAPRTPMPPIFAWGDAGLVAKIRELAPDTCPPSFRGKGARQACRAGDRLGEQLPWAAPVACPCPSTMLRGRSPVRGSLPQRVAKTLGELRGHLDRQTCLASYPGISWTTFKWGGTSYGSVLDAAIRAPCDGGVIPPRAGTSRSTRTGSGIERAFPGRGERPRGR